MTILIKLISKNLNLKNLMFNFTLLELSTRRQEGRCSVHLSCLCAVSYKLVYTLLDHRHAFYRRTPSCQVVQIICVCVCDNIYSYLFIKFCRLSFLHNSNNSSRLYFSFTEFILSAGGFCTEFVLYGVMKQFLNLYLFLIDPTCK